MKHRHLPPMKSHAALASGAFGIGVVFSSVVGQTPDANAAVPFAR
jgi:hypothetical protein